MDGRFGMPSTFPGFCCFCWFFASALIWQSSFQHHKKQHPLHSKTNTHTHTPSWVAWCFFGTTLIWIFSTNIMKQQNILMPRSFRGHNPTIQPQRCLRFERAAEVTSMCSWGFLMKHQGGLRRVGWIFFPFRFFHFFSLFPPCPGRFLERFHILSCYTLPETNSSSLEMDDWKTILLFLSSLGWNKTHILKKTTQSFSLLPKSSSQTKHEKQHQILFASKKAKLRRLPVFPTDSTWKTQCTTFLMQLWLVLRVKLMEINHNLFSR